MVCAQRCRAAGARCGTPADLVGRNFDVAILLDDRSFGSSPGDDFYSAPYADVSAHDHDGEPFWNAPFGALRDAGDFSSADDLAALWREARVLLRGGLAGDSIAIAGLE
jgi:hypothetical protein